LYEHVGLFVQYGTTIGGKLFRAAAAITPFANSSANFRFILAAVGVADVEAVLTHRGDEPPERLLRYEPSLDD